MANKMDATYLYAAATWVMAELVRVFHSVSTSEAQDSVDALAERRVPLVWEVGGKKRVLAPDMRAKDKVLVLLHASSGGAGVAELQQWVRYKSKFVQQVLAPLEGNMLIEVDAARAHAVMTPLGVQRVESEILSKRSAFLTA